MDADGNVLAPHDYKDPMNAEGFGKTLAKANDFVDLRKRADGGDKAAKAEHFLQALALNHFTAEDARTRAKEVELSEEQRRKADAEIVDLEVAEALAAIVPEDKETRLAAGKKFAEMKKAGRVPTGDRTFQPFWILMMDYAEGQKDAALFEEALDAVRKKFADNPRAKKFLEEKQKVLDGLKEKK